MLKRRGGPEAAGLEWLGADGEWWGQIHASKQGLGVHYNPLHPAVQEAMLGVVQDLAKRAGEHKSFAGVAVQLSADSYAVAGRRRL